MGPRQTAVNTLSYSTRSRPKAEVGQSVGKNDRNQRLRMSTPRRAPPRAVAGPTVVRAGRRRLVERQNRFPRRRTNPIEVSGRPTGRPGRERPGRGRVASCNDFLLAQAASRAALHVQIGSRNMTSVSSSNSTELGYGVLALKSAQATGTARQLRRAARSLRTASAVVG